MAPKPEEEKETKQVKEEPEKETKRELVIPGETIATGQDFLPGENTKREGKDIVALRFGLADKSDRLIKIIPLSGVYIPRRGNTVIGKVEDISFNGWMVNINAPYGSFLSLAECPRFVNKNELQEFLDLGDMVVCKVWSVKRKGVDLTIKSRGLGKLEGGIIMYINSNKVPRVIGKAGSMINLIKQATNCDITVGQNGVIWIRGNKIEDELFAEKAIRFVTEKSFIDGLTDKTQKWLESQKKTEIKRPEKKEEIKKVEIKKPELKKEEKPEKIGGKK